jgi:uncharacterized membrane protein
VGGFVDLDSVIAMCFAFLLFGLLAFLVRVVVSGFGFCGCPYFEYGYGYQKV